MHKATLPGSTVPPGRVVPSVKDRLQARQFRGFCILPAASRPETLLSNPDSNFP
jgi:hypothetical protein